MRIMCVCDNDAADAGSTGIVHLFVLVCHLLRVRLDLQQRLREPNIIYSDLHRRRLC